MITRWTLTNFKAIRSRTEIVLSPVTVLSGLNSSGKSSILQSIRLVSQTLRNQTPSRPLIMNGYDVQLFSLDTVRNNRSESEEIGIGFEIALDLPNRELAELRLVELRAESDDRLSASVSCEAFFSSPSVRVRAGAKNARARVIGVDDSRIALDRCVQNIRILESGDSSLSDPEDVSRTSNLQILVKPLDREERARIIEKLTLPIASTSALRSGLHFVAEIEKDGNALRERAFRGINVSLPD
jgi:hypothetical protein